MTKQYHFIRSMRDKHNNYMVLFHVGNYQYEICVQNRTIKVDGTTLDAINVMESLAVL
jgi:CMP-2-keto-3-deoxyoctulosonic acid synthetase